jgi:anti-sigma regulatory factor (Ser/Thr protein kinase)
VGGGALRALGVGEGRVGDAAVAVTEAVSNVVGHAYPAGGGEFEVEVRVTGEGFEVVVRDEGCGYGAARPETAGAGFGLMLMEGLSESLRVGDRPPRRAEVLMTFPLI